MQRQLCSTRRRSASRWPLSSPTSTTGSRSCPSFTCSRSSARYAAPPHCALPARAREACSRRPRRIALHSVARHMLLRREALACRPARRAEHSQRVRLRPLRCRRKSQTTSSMPSRPTRTVASIASRSSQASNLARSKTSSRAGLRDGSVARARAHPEATRTSTPRSRCCSTCRQSERLGHLHRRRSAHTARLRSSIHHHCNLEVLCFGLRSE